jgi:hypothetical protein
VALARANPGDRRVFSFSFFFYRLFEVALALAVVILDAVGRLGHVVKQRKCI